MLTPQLAAGQASPPPLPAHISTAHPPAAKSTATISARRNDELTLAGLRPGQDDMAKAQKFFRKPSVIKFDGTNLIWNDKCRNQSLSIITDADSGTIQEVRVYENNSKFASGTPSSTVAESGCASATAAASEARSRWITGHGLAHRLFVLARFRVVWATRFARSFHERRPTVRIVVLRLRLGGSGRSTGHGGTLHSGEQRQTGSSSGHHIDGAKPLMNLPTQ